MRLGALSVVLVDRSLREVAELMRGLGLESIELGAGGFIPNVHCNPAALLADRSGLQVFQETLSEFELTVSALAIHGEPLHPDPAIAEAYDRDFRNACMLAEKIGATRLTLLAGLPEAAPGDKTPNWILSPFPPWYMDKLEWQWEERLIPYWKEHGQIAEDHGVRLCFEMHPIDMVFKPEALLRLRDAVGPVIGCNLDPSHLFWQGMDILEVIRALGDAIYHVHAKDARLDPHNVRVNGVLDAKTFQNHANRSWLFRTVGFGHGEHFWREFVSTLRLVGYNDVISIEHEDPLVDPEEGLVLAVDLLRGILLRKPPGAIWFD